MQRPPIDRAKEIIQTLDTTLHEGTQQRVGVLIKRRSLHIRHRQDNMPIDDAFMEHLADLSHPIIHIDLGTSQAQRRLTAHGNEMLALTTIETSVSLLALAAFAVFLGSVVLAGYDDHRETLCRWGGSAVECL